MTVILHISILALLYMFSRRLPTAFGLKTSSNSHSTATPYHTLRYIRHPQEEKQRDHSVGYALQRFESIRFYCYGVPGVRVADMLYSEHCQAVGHINIMDHAHMAIPSALMYHEGTVHFTTEVSMICNHT